MTARPGFSRAATEPPLALVVLTISWRLAGMWSHSAASSAPEMSGPSEIEFVLDAVEGAVADEDQHEVVVGLGLRGRPGPAFRSDARGWPRSPVERVDVRVACRRP